MAGESPPDPVDHWLFWPFFAAGCLAAAALPLLYTYLPMHDWPQHCAAAALLSHYHDPAYRFSEYYRLTGEFLPYQIFRLMQIGLGRLLGDSLGFRAALLPYFLATPLAVAALLRRLGRDRWVALSVFCVLCEQNILWGFVPSATGIPMVLFGAVLALDWLRGAVRGTAPPARTRGPSGTLLCSAGLGLLLFFTHPIMTAIWGATCGGLSLWAWLSRRVSFSRAALLVLTLLPPQALLLIFLLRSGWVSGDPAALSGDVGVSFQHGMVWFPPWTLLGALPVLSGLRLMGSGPLWAYGAALAAVLLGALALWWAGGRGTGTAAWPEAEGGWVLFAVWLLVMLALPAKMNGESVSTRFASGIALAALWLPPMHRPQDRRQARALLPARLGLVLAAAGSLWLAHARFRYYDHSLRPLDQIAARIPMGSRVVPLIYAPTPVGLALPDLLYIGGYLQAARGGLSPLGFTRLGFTYRSSVPRSLLLVNRSWAAAREGWVLTREFTTYYDYAVVLRGPRYPGLPWDPREGPQGTLVLAAGELQLWRLHAH